ncbi:hypothetical protein K1719_018491 [Acacia pycnantha]|nr:hypothetical protein K1719_018491 [Acacia pycnantha]
MALIIKSHHLVLSFLLALNFFTFTAQASWWFDVTNQCPYTVWAAATPTGDCGGQLYCRLSGQPPATLAEFSLNKWNNLDFYDISVIDGFNVPMEFSPTSNCRGLRCYADKCPDAYLYPEDNTKTHSCEGGTDYRVVFCP